MTAEEIAAAMRPGPRLTTAAAALAAHGVVAVTLTRIGQPCSVYGTAPPEIAAEYWSQGLGWDDPVWFRALTDPRPRLWTEETPAYPRTPEQRAVLEWSAVHGAPDGVCVPVQRFAPSRIIAVASFACASTEAAGTLLARHLLELFAWAELLYDEAETLDLGFKGLLPVVDLSFEQEEILRLLVADKAAGDIAAILGLSTFMVRREIQKLAEAFRVASQSQLRLVAAMSGLA